MQKKLPETLNKYMKKNGGEERQFFLNQPYQAGEVKSPRKAAKSSAKSPKTPAPATQVRLWEVVKYC